MRFIRSKQPELAHRAGVMRHAMTPSEDKLWQRIRCRQLGVTFRRQVPLHMFIVDFLASEARLVVEVDGGYHRERAHLDVRRDEKLQRLGYRVLRLPAELRAHTHLRCASAAALIRRYGP